MSFTTLIDYLQHNWLEVIGIFTSLLCIWLNTLQNTWGWFWSIVSSGIYAVIYWQYQLYSDMELQGIFIILSLYGWYQWLYGTKEQENLKVTKIPFKLVPFCGLFCLVFALASGYYHANSTDASFPYLDATLTAISLIAVWMTAKKYLENWILWIFADFIYTGMYFSKHLIGTSILYFLLLLLAVKGYMDWKKTAEINHE